MQIFTKIRDGILHPRSARAALAAIAVLGSTTAMASDRLNRTVAVINDSQISTVMELYMSHVDDTSWRSDLLGWNVLEPGYYGYFAPTNHQGYCLFDVLVVFDTGQQDILEAVDLCKATELEVNDRGFSWISY